MQHRQTARRRFSAALQGATIPFYMRRWKRFEQKLATARQVQQDWLFCRLRRCQETRFGQDHGFAQIHNLADFRQQVPVSRYDYFAPYIDAVARGEFDALVPDDDRVLRFTITTGSSGSPKLNPVTTTWLKEYRYAWDVWGLKLLLDHADRLGGKILQLAGTWNMGTTPGGLQISMVSALLARYQHPFVRPFYAIPNALNEVSDPVARYYTALRLSVTEDIGLIILMNPGTLIRLATLGNEHREDLIRDIHDGTLSRNFEIPDAVREILRKRTRRRAPSRAKELEGTVERLGRLYPRDYWDEPTIGCWLGGTAGYQMRYLPEYFGEAPLRDMGLVSSEGRHTIPIEDGKPEGVLSITAGYYEFIPAEEIDAAHPTILEGHELEHDRDYYLLMTTSAGYYRFSIGDIVRCRGFVGEAPLLEFLQKGDRCGDLEGEKLTERQFLDAATEVAAELQITLGQITAIPTRPEGDLPCYVVIVEGQTISSQPLRDQFLQRLDERLMSVNFLYAARRREGVLGFPRLHPIALRAWERFISEEVARRGTGDYQYKHPGLVQDDSWLERLPAVPSPTWPG